MRSLIARVVETEDELEAVLPRTSASDERTRVFCGGSRVRPFLAAGAAIILAGACDPFGFVPAPPVRSTS
jgi:hypothetical protein